MPALKQLMTISALSLALTSAPYSLQAESSFDILRSYYATDVHLPLEIEITAENGSITEFFFSAFDNERVRARLERPDATLFPGRRPLVVLLHGITQSLDQWWRTDEGPYSFPSAHRETLVENGFAVLAIDLRNHGDRLQGADFEDPYAYLENAYFEAARKMISQSAIDVRRAVQTVGTFHSIDADRISLAGFSLGAWTGLIATAVEPRIDRAVFIGLPFLPPAEGETTHFISQTEYAPGLAGKPIHFVAGTTDHFHTREAVDAMMAALTKDASITWVESGHDFPRDTAALTLEFLKGDM